MVAPSPFAARRPVARIVVDSEFSQGENESSASQDADHTSHLRRFSRPSILRDLGSTSKLAHTQDRRAGKTRTSNAAAIHSPSQSSVPMTKSEYANSRGRFLVEFLATLVMCGFSAGRALKWPRRRWFCLRSVWGSRIATQRRTSFLARNFREGASSYLLA